MFILSTIDNIINDYIRRTGKSTKGKTCRKETRGTRDSIRDSKERSSGSRELSGLGKDNVSICCKGRQCSQYLESFARIRITLSLIPLYFLYNSHLWTLLFIIDMSFSDELININIIQLNTIVQNIQRFNNIGVV